MKNLIFFFSAVCLVLSGCGKGDDNSAEPENARAEQALEALAQSQDILEISHASATLSMTIETDDNKFTVLWGDGTLDVVEGTTTVSHYYPDASVRRVTVFADRYSGISSAEFHTPLTDIDVRRCVYLYRLAFSGNVSSVDLRENINLMQLEIDGGSFTSLDLSANTWLTNLTIQNSALASIDLSRMSHLRDLRVPNNRLTALNLWNNRELSYVKCGGNPFLSSPNTAIAMAQTLPSRTSADMGRIAVGNSSAYNWIRPTCDSKNWRVDPY